MDKMDPASAISFVCKNQDAVVAVLTWAMGVVPVASAAAWANAKYDKLPPWAHVVLQILAMNFVHALAGEPKTEEKK